MFLFSLGVSKSLRDFGFQVGWCSFSFDLMVGAENPDLDASPQNKKSFPRWWFQVSSTYFFNPYLGK